MQCLSPLPNKALRGPHGGSTVTAASLHKFGSVSQSFCRAQFCLFRKFHQSSLYLLCKPGPSCLEVSWVDSWHNRLRCHLFREKTPSHTPIHKFVICVLYERYTSAFLHTKNCTHQHHSVWVLLVSSCVQGPDGSQNVTPLCSCFSDLSFLENTKGSVCTD